MSDEHAPPEALAEGEGEKLHGMRKLMHLPHSGFDSSHYRSRRVKFEFESSHKKRDSYLDLASLTLYTSVSRFSVDSPRVRLGQAHLGRA